jgi:dihydrodipicolinate synthase/N-acetylneuraminate lyase
MKLEGLVVPVPTLFTDRGDLDPGKNARFVRDLAAAKVDHLFVLGSLGEFPSVSDEERARLLEATIDSIPGRADAWVGCGAPSTRQAVRYATDAEAAGAAVIVAVPPYYLHPVAGAIDRYYRAIRAAIGIPLLAYNIPSLVGYALDPARLHGLYRDRVIAGVKDTSGAIESVASFLKGAPAGFVVFPGDDALVAESVARGSTGAVMGLGNIVPKLCVELVAAARGGDAARVTELHALVSALVEVTRAGPFPSTVKFLAALLRHAEVGYRAPYDPLTAEEEHAVLERLEPLRARLAPFLGT